MNAAPPRSWDDAEYLADSVSTYHALERGDLTEFVRLASRPARGVHPPMIKLVPIPMYVLFGPGTKAALYSYTALIPVFCVYVFLLARIVSKSRRTAILAVAVTCLLPLTFGLWRVALAEFGLAVATVAALYHLFRSADGRSGHVAHAVLAGAFIGWGLLWKISLPVFVAGPLCYVLVRNLRRRNDPGRPSGLPVVPLIALAAVAVAGPFYFLRIGSMWGFVLYNSTPSASLEQFSLGPVLSPITVLKYWAGLVNFGTSAYFFLVLAGLTILQLRRRQWPLRTPETWFVGSCAIVPLVFFSFQYLKEPRHLFPAFVMFGIVFAALLEDNLARTTYRARAAAIAALLAFPAYQFAFLSFDFPWVPSRDVRLGPLTLIPADRDSLFVRPANATTWPVGEIVGLIATNSEEIQGRAARVRVAGHIPFLDGPVLNYTSLLHHRRPLVYSMLGDRSLHPTWWDFVVVLSGPVRQPSEYRESLLEKLLDAERLPFTELGRVALPEGREAVLYRAAAAPLLTTGSDENVITATDRNGEVLFPVAKAEWHLRAGRGAVAVTRGEAPIEFEYVYVPGTAQSLSWEVVSHPQANCESSAYAVTVFDLNSRRGPARRVFDVFEMPAGRERGPASLDIAAFRGQIVTIELSLLSGTPPSCIGWSGLHIVEDPALPGQAAAHAGR